MEDEHVSDILLRVQLRRLPVLKWLLANRVEGCTINAVNWAARRYSPIKLYPTENTFFTCNRFGPFFPCSLCDRRVVAKYVFSIACHHEKTFCGVRLSRRD